MNYFRNILSTCGHVSCIGILVTTNILISGIDTIARSMVRIIATVTLAQIEQDSRTPHSERVRTFQNDTKEAEELVVYKPDTSFYKGDSPNQIIDEAETLKRTVAYAKKTLSKKSCDFLGDEEKMTAMAYDVIRSEFGGTKPEVLADDFQFLFPVVGPLTKEQFLDAFGKFKVRDAFPTSSPNYWNFRVDPLEPNRIWFLARGKYEHLGVLQFGPKGIKPTGKKISLPPQVFSMSFDEEGKCYKLTGGYNVDRTVGDTKGLGGMFGIVTALGEKIPFAEGKPWKRSLLWEALALRLPQIIMDWTNTAKPTKSSKQL
mmetsp:Transcript_26782/g.30612  ORF Transcript_26782/g.30612 Transcript_26782/m.30612 type:complete len:316 (+) Transcript_26782:154-1101(+)|eukprot:CAMPEP_0194142772 /NCGR_PEP_ID=MMETSP0152-20130528/11993_1 /TAXON_ID=1049557 /ORGANISM="Thalassiothrix antarctica, Strain L6-D1" /LENGTH=315 /DNA_ID=CAMNT_0038841855 /DNA_START=103 /DNA_END=1050 /DNA_ORIENTATION=+